MTSTQSALKKPIGVYILALLFILAPIGNVLISFAGSGVQSWFLPSVFFPFLQSIPFYEWSGLGLLFLTGILLLRPHKLSWSIAIVSLLLVLAINSYRLYTGDINSIDPTFLKVFSLLAMICTLGFLVIAFHFRFPYLDRRANWFMNIKRFKFQTTALCNGVETKTESVSMKGCRLLFSTPTSLTNEETAKIQFPSISKLEVEAVVVEKSELEVRVEFKNLTGDFKQDLGRWIRSQQD